MAGSIFKKRIQEDDGSVSVEFVILFPVIIGMVLLIFEAGWAMTKMMMLDRGLDIAMRDIRLGAPGSSDYDQIRNKICSHSRILSDCTSNLKMQLQKYEYNPAWTPTDSRDSFPWDAAACTDDLPIEIDPVTGEIKDRSGPDDNWDPGQRDVNMFIRVCITHNPIFPGLGSLLLAKGRDDPSNPLKESYQLVAFSAFRNEY
ncbi:TadE/TadG family type IV pilus assembly protein [Halovulum sp. GXIMD14793]